MYMWLDWSWSRSHNTFWSRPHTLWSRSHRVMASLTSLPVCPLARLREKFSSDFYENLCDYELLLWKEPIKFWMLMCIHNGRMQPFWISVIMLYCIWTICDIVCAAYAGAPYRLSMKNNKWFKIFTNCWFWRRYTHTGMLTRPPVSRSRPTVQRFS